MCMAKLIGAIVIVIGYCNTCYNVTTIINLVDKFGNFDLLSFTIFRIKSICNK